MSKALNRRQVERIRRLYEAMPGAPEPSREGGDRMWGDVEGNDHWLFCETIVRMMDAEIGAAINSMAGAHNLV